MEKTPYVDQDTCISCNLCADMVPEVFRMNDDSVAEVHDPKGAPVEKIEEAVEACPVACIHWQD